MITAVEDLNARGPTHRPEAVPVEAEHVDKAIAKQLIDRTRASKYIAAGGPSTPEPDLSQVRHGCWQREIGASELADCR